MATKKSSINYVGTPGNVPIPSDLPNAQKINNPSIIKAGGIENGSLTIYTVPTGKVFSWTSLILERADTNAGGGQVYLKVGNVDLFGLMGIPRIGGETINQAFNPPSVYAAGTQFIVRSELLGTIAFCTIVGFESDAITS